MQPLFPAQKHANQSFMVTIRPSNEQVEQVDIFINRFAGGIGSLNAGYHRDDSEQIHAQMGDSTQKELSGHYPVPVNQKLDKYHYSDFSNQRSNTAIGLSQWRQFS
jgi:hypothetical protein